MPDYSLEIARPLAEHARQVMDWRNDPITLASFFRRKPKVWEQFWPEFQNEYFSDPSLPPIFVLQSGKRVAFLRFRRIQSPQESLRPCCDISINTDAAIRGQGVGITSLNMATEFLRNHGIKDVLAEIRVENAASIRTFEKAGYVRLERTVKHIEDTGEDCHIYRYLLRIA